MTQQELENHLWGEATALLSSRERTRNEVREVTTNVGTALQTTMRAIGQATGRLSNSKMKLLTSKWRPQIYFLFHLNYQSVN